jgi:hypothetical protein
MSVIGLDVALPRYVESEWWGIQAKRNRDALAAAEKATVVDMRDADELERVVDVTVVLGQTKSNQLGK